MLKEIFALKFYLLRLTLTLLFGIAISAQTGGNYTITESVVGSGGNSGGGGAYTVDSTNGQPAGGGALRGPGFSITSGFWNFTPLAPTAAQVSIGGRVRTADGRGIQQVGITLTALDGSTRRTTSSTFGYYRFDQVTVGESYIVTIKAKRFIFGEPTLVVSVFDQIEDLDFIANALP